MDNYVILDKICSPEDIKNLNISELEVLSKEIRHFLIKSVTETGGHLASNLGVVELTLALHRVFDFSKDHLIFDVGHQCYTHKILTGRKNSFFKLRKRGGLSGFTKTSESIYDCFGAGHSSTSVSAALGFAESDKLNGCDKYTVAVLGDGAFTGGMVHEALNNCKKDLKLIIILNENEMSIAKNIGSFARHIAKIRSSKGYYRTKRKTANIMLKIPFIGYKLFNIARRFKQLVKNHMFKGNYFEDLGLSYLGPIDGNDIEKVERMLCEAKNANQSTVIHLRTVKGKGYKEAEDNPGKYHSVVSAGTEIKKNFSSAMGEILIELASEHKNICAVTAAMAEGTGLRKFALEFPDRFYDVGIAEEHALTFCAGLAANNIKPYFAVYSSFLQRGYDNLIHDIALQKLAVTVLIDRSGLSLGDGPTHHGIFDVSFLSGIPHIEIYTPSCFSSMRRIMEKSVNSRLPVAIRYSNEGDMPCIDEIFNYGDFDVRANASCGEYMIITYGRTVSVALKVCERLKSEHDAKCCVVLLEKLKPYDDISLKINGFIDKNTKKIVFLEEGIRNGGAGMILREKISTPKETEYIHLAVDGVFDTPFNTGDIYTDFGIGEDNVINAFGL